MAENTWRECLEVFSRFLDETSLGNLEKKHRVNSNANEFLKDLLEIFYDSFSANFIVGKEDDFADHNSFVASFAEHLPVFFSSTALFEVSKACLQELTCAGNNVGSSKLCEIVLEVVKSCPLTWLLPVNASEAQNLEMSYLEKSKDNIATFLLFLLKYINLMSLNAEELDSHPKLQLFPRILVLCHSLLRKLWDNTEVLTDIVSRKICVSILKKIACDAVMVCIQQTGRCHWVMEISRNAALEFLEFIAGGCGYKDIDGLLSGSETEVPGNVGEPQETKIFPNGILGNILQSIKHFMSKGKLIESPVMIHVLVQSIRKVRHPFLGQHISMLLPPLLLLVDDYRVHNRVTGIQSLEYLVENTNATELSWYGRAEVIHEALHHRVHSNEPEVMHALQPCLLKVLKVIEPSPKKPIPGRKMNKCDHNFQIILSSMEFESKIAMRRAYCSHLAQFVEHMGITVLRHFKRLVRVVFRYLEIGDGETEEWRLVMLDVLKSIIRNAWPRIPCYANEILQSLMKVVVDVSFSSLVSSEVKQKMFMKIEECLLLLLLCCGEPVKKQLEAMTTGLGHSKTEELVSRILHSYGAQIDYDPTSTN